VLLRIQTNLNSSHNDECERWQQYGRGRFHASPSPAYTIKDLYAVREFEPEQYEGIEDRRTGPALTPRVQTWPEGLTLAPVWYREPKPDAPPRLVDIPKVAQPYDPRVQRFEKGERVDCWSNELGDYAHLDAEGRRIYSPNGKGFLARKGIGWIVRPWTAPHKPSPATRKNGGLIRYWTGMYYKWLLPAESWEDDQLVRGIRDTSIMRSTIGKPAEQMDVSDWFCWIHSAPEARSYRLVGDKQTKGILDAGKDTPEWIILPRTAFLFAKMAHWPRTMVKRNCTGGKIMGMESGDWHRGFPKRKQFKRASEFISINPADHRTKKDCKLGWPPQPSRACLNYRFLLSSRVRPEHYSGVPRGHIPLLAVVKGFGRAQCDLYVGDFERAFYDSYADSHEDSQMEIAPEGQMSVFFSPPPGWIYEMKRDSTLQKFWHASMAYQRLRVHDRATWEAEERDGQLSFDDPKHRDTIIVHMYRAGNSVKEIIRFVGCSETTVKDAIKKHKKTVPGLGRLLKPHMNYAPLEVMLEKLKEGRSRSEVAKILYVDRSTIDNWVEEVERLLEIEQGGKNADHG
jgi:transposase